MSNKRLEMLLANRGGGITRQRFLGLLQSNLFKRIFWNNINRNRF